VTFFGAAVGRGLEDGLTIPIQQQRNILWSSGWTTIGRWFDNSHSTTMTQWVVLQDDINEHFHAQRWHDSFTHNDDAHNDDRTLEQHGNRRFHTQQRQTQRRWNAYIVLLSDKKL